MRDIAFTTVFLGLLPFAFRRPWFGLMIWAWLGYMNPHRLCYTYFVYMGFPFVAITAGVTLLSLLTRESFESDRWRIAFSASFGEGVQAHA